MSAPRHASSSSRGPGDGMVRAGAVLFALGGVGVLLTVLAYFFSDGDAGLASLVLTALMPLGLGIALLGLLRGARASRRDG